MILCVHFHRFLEWFYSAGFFLHFGDQHLYQCTFIWISVSRQCCIFICTLHTRAHTLACQAQRMQNQTREFPITHTYTHILMHKFCVCCKSSDNIDSGSHFHWNLLQHRMQWMVRCAMACAVVWCVIPYSCNQVQTFANMQNIMMLLIVSLRVSHRLHSHILFLAAKNYCQVFGNQHLSLLQQFHITCHQFQVSILF